MSDVATPRVSTYIYLYLYRVDAIHVKLKSYFPMLQNSSFTSRSLVRFRRTDESLNELVWPEKFHQGRFDLEKRRDEKFKSRLR